MAGFDRFMNVKHEDKTVYDDSIFLLILSSSLATGDSVNITPSSTHHEPPHCTRFRITAIALHRQSHDTKTSAQASCWMAHNYR